MTPFELKPVIIWGGTRLRDEFGMESDSQRLAESWELSCHRDGMSIVSGGEFSGMTLEEVLAANPEFLGDAGKLSVMIKLIDAKERLSVQVHPDDEYARKYENDNGKTEMWYVVDALPDAELICGVKEPMTREELKNAVEENTLLDKLKRIPVKKGDVFFITPGTLHAIGAGILIAEIQQSSNVTYRVYDYGRSDDNGKLRELHIDKAIEVARLEPEDASRSYPAIHLSAGEYARTTVRLLADCEYFTVTLTELDDSGFDINVDETSFRHMLVIEGSAELIREGISYHMKKGSSWFVPAGAGNITVRGKCSIINTEKIKTEEE